jgi:hypothetical protein
VQDISLILRRISRFSVQFTAPHTRSAYFADRPEPQLLAMRYVGDVIFLLHTYYTPVRFFQFLGFPLRVGDENWVPLSTVSRPFSAERERERGSAFPPKNNMFASTGIHSDFSKIVSRETQDQSNREGVQQGIT